MFKRSLTFVLTWAMLFSMFTGVGTPASAAQSKELLANPGFENGLYPWYAQGAQTVAETVYTNSGSASLKVYGRQGTWGSAVQNITGLLQTKGAGSYTYSGYIRLVEGAGQSVTNLIVKITDDAGDRYLGSNDTQINDHSFTKVETTQEISWTGTLRNAEIFLIRKMAAPIIMSTISAL